MTLKLIGTCYSQGSDGRRSFRTVIGVDEEWRLCRRKFDREEIAMRYGRRLFKKLEQSGRWEKTKTEV